MAMEQISESDPQFVHFQHGCPTLSREEQVVLFHALRNQGMTFASNGTVAITNSVIHGPVAGINFGTMQSIIQMLPEPIDPLPAALAALAAIPLDHVPQPRSDLPHASRLPFEASPHFVGREDELKQLAAAIVHACEVPLQVAQQAASLFDDLYLLATQGNVNARTDAQVGGYLAYAAVNGAGLNVLVNLGDLSDAQLREQFSAAVAKLRQQAEQGLQKLTTL